MSERSEAPSLACERPETTCRKDKKGGAKSSSKPSMAAPLKGRLNLITCVLQRGKANDVAKAAMQAGAKGATVVYGRGWASAS